VISQRGLLPRSASHHFGPRTGGSGRVRGDGGFPDRLLSPIHPLQGWPCRQRDPFPQGPEGHPMFLDGLQRALLQERMIRMLLGQDDQLDQPKKQSASVKVKLFVARHRYPVFHGALDIVGWRCSRRRSPECCGRPAQEVSP